MNERVVDSLMFFGEITAFQFLIGIINNCVLRADCDCSGIVKKEINLPFETADGIDIMRIHEGDIFPLCFFKRSVIADCQSVAFFILVNLKMSKPLFVLPENFYRVIP